MGLSAAVAWIGGTQHGHVQEHTTADGEKVQIISPHCVGCSEDPVGELEEWQGKARKEERDRIRGDVTGTEMSTVGGMSDENNDTSAASDKPPVNDVRVNDLADILETGTN